VSEFWEIFNIWRSSCWPFCLFWKGSLIMTTLPLAQGARLLGIHPKTLRHWLKQSHLPLVPHPGDARIKCVTQDHLQQVASLYGRQLQAPGPPQTPSPVPVAPELRTQSSPEGVVAPSSPASSLSASSLSEADLLEKLTRLETKVATQQEQLAHLALALLQERERSMEHRITALESLMQQLVGRPLPDPPSPETDHPSAVSAPKIRPLIAAEQQARSRMPALIEYSPQGIYVIVSSQEGELHLVPDSPEWFEWLATLSSFRFVGKLGRFSACRDSEHGQQTRSWVAHRSMRGQRYKHYLGTTDHLTLTCLEQMAARLQAEVAAAS
jgi:hypothetical protein